MRQRLIGFLLMIVTLSSVMVVWARPIQQANVFELFLLQARNDLEIMANTVRGEGNRPQSWTFNFEPGSGTFLADLWFDHETLAEEVFGAGVRPDNWFGATTANSEILARNIRHDLELSADRVYGDANSRPEGWNGAEAIYRCNRTLQNLTRTLEVFYELTPVTPQGVINYCETLIFELETQLLPEVYDDISAFDTSLNSNILAVRGDLERTANEIYGVNTRPGAWIGNVDANSVTLAADISTDLETLAEEVYGGLNRPEGWARFIPESEAVSLLNLRFNLETLTDEALGAGSRPNGWQSTDPLGRCNARIQTLSLILNRFYNFTVDTTLADERSDFCAAAAFTINSFSESPPEGALDEIIESEADAIFTAESQNAFSYLDVGTTQYMGIMPSGTRFRAWYRNYQQSTMMYVTGVDQDFGLFIDRRWTTLDPDIFARLPNLDGVRPNTYCNVSWCNGPGPTPTPTGGGPLVRLHQGEGATAIPQQQSVEEVSDETGKTQVSWNFVRVTYLLDRTDLGVAQVALEICQEPQQINCEPVIAVFDQALGAARPVVSQFNGLNVYELPYGYSNTLVIEGATLVSPDVWISDPTIR